MSVYSCNSSTATKEFAGAWIIVSGGLCPRPTLALTPYEEASSIEYGLAGGSIRQCDGRVNPNCVSTRSLDQMYGPAIRSTLPSATASADALETAVLAVCPESDLVSSESLEEGEYRAFTVKSLFGLDRLEFFIRNKSANDRYWEGDSEGPIVTYRSMAGSVKYVWPLQTPVSDMGTQKKRIEAIRRQLGWPLIGCELIECYQ
eukprot:jgi/Botrbrau1/17735/Bobra.0166s0153.3